MAFNNTAKTNWATSTAYDWDDSVMAWDGAGAWDAGTSGTEFTNKAKNIATFTNEAKN